MVGIAWIGIVMGLAQLAAAVPLDLADPSPRWIEVRFEVSPADQPGRLDREWSEPRRAYLAPDPAGDAIQIRIPAAVIEAHLRSTGTDAIEGSFSEFVWTLEPASGRVLGADLSGRVREEIRLGPIRSSVQIEIEVEMTTEAGAGFEPGHGIMGVPTNRFCAPEPPDDGCVGVTPVRFEPSRGYVNAVGSLRARSKIIEIRTFSPLGEVEFLELRPRATETVISGTSRSEALCSGPFSDPCRIDLGGDS